MTDFKHIDFNSDEFLFALQELGEFENENNGKFKEVKECYVNFFDKMNISYPKDAKYVDLENIVVELSQEFAMCRKARIAEITAKHLIKDE